MSNTSSQARGIDSAIDLGVAALAAISVGFVTYAMPEDLFSSLVAATHLPDLVAAAAPPLGMKARLAVVGGDALVTFALVWALLHALGGKKAARPVAKAARKKKKKVMQLGSPRVRRADAHPDAPAPRPLFAGSDLGEPETTFDDEEDDRPFAEPPFSVKRGSAAQDEAEVEDRPEAVPEDRGTLPRFLVAEDAEPAPSAPEIPEPQAEAERAAAESREQRFEALVARLKGNDETSSDRSSIGSLMQRLERGLSEREEQPIQEWTPEEPELPRRPAMASADRPEPPLSSDGVRHRLRNAITDMNQIAKRG